MVGLVLTIALINLVPLLVTQVEDLRQDLPRSVEETQQWIESNANVQFSDFGLEPDFVEERLSVISEEIGGTLSSYALPLLLSTFTVAIEGLVYIIASFYFIVYGDRFVLALRDILNRRYHREFDRLILDINSTLGRYIRGQLLLVVIMSTASFIALAILRVDYALSVAIATGFLELIPLIGPWSAGAIAVSIALFQETTPFGWSNVTLAIVVGITYFALRQLEDSFVIPLVIGRIVHLHPLLVILVLVLGTSLGGVLGLILAVPVAAVLKIIFSFFYAKLMARETRHVEVIRDHHDFDRLSGNFPEMVNATVVLLIEPGALAWDDLPLVQRIASEALDHAIALSVVTPDPIAGALATAAGMTTSTIPVSLPVAMEPVPR
jgi:predicted PurR-regulated permease PerM